MDANEFAAYLALRKHYPSLHYSIAAYDPWNAGDVIDLAEAAYRELLAPHISRAGFETALGWYQMIGARPRSGRSKTMNWKLPRKPSILNGLAVEMNSPEAEAPIFWDRTARISATISTVYEGSFPSFEMSLKPHVLYGNGVPASIQHIVVNHAKAAFVRLPGIVGNITFDWVYASDGGGWPPYERWLRVTHPLAAVDFQTKERLFYRRTRGYYWGNFLNFNHVDILGGEQALSRAPVALVERLENGWYLQLTDDINDIDRGRLHELRDFLAPVLPVAYYDTRRPPDYDKTLPALVL